LLTLPLRSWFSRPFQLWVMRSIGKTIRGTDHNAFDLMSEKRGGQLAAEIA